MAVRSYLNGCRLGYTEGWQEVQVGVLGLGKAMAGTKIECLVLWKVT